MHARRPFRLLGQERPSSRQGLSPGKVGRSAATAVSRHMLLSKVWRRRTSAGSPAWVWRYLRPDCVNSIVVGSVRLSGPQPIGSRDTRASREGAAVIDGSVVDASGFGHAMLLYHDIREYAAICSGYVRSGFVRSGHLGSGHLTSGYVRSGAAAQVQTLIAGTGWNLAGFAQDFRTRPLASAWRT